MSWRSAENRSSASVWRADCISADRPAVPDLRGRAGNCTGALAQGLSVVLPAGREPLLTRQLAARIGASTAEQGEAAAAWQALKKQGRPALLRAGEPRAELEEPGPVLTLETLADAPAVFRVCRRAVRSSRMLTGAAAALAVLLAGCAGGIFAPGGRSRRRAAALRAAGAGRDRADGPSGHGRDAEADQNRINDKRTRRASPCAFYVLMRPPPDRCR